MHGHSSISSLCPFASGQQAASRPESLSTGIFTMTLTAEPHGPQLPGVVAHDSQSTHTSTSSGLSRVSPSVRLISCSTWSSRGEGPQVSPPLGGGAVRGEAITLPQEY